jgi:hypothetical protein
VLEPNIQVVVSKTVQSTQNCYSAKQMACPKLDRVPQCNSVSSLLKTLYDGRLNGTSSMVERTAVIRILAAVLRSSLGVICLWLKYLRIWRFRGLKMQASSRRIRCTLLKTRKECSFDDLEVHANAT